MQPAAHARRLRHVRTPSPLHFPEEALVPETKRHLEMRTLLYLVLKACSDRAAIGSSQFVYWSASDPSRCLAPDAFVRLGTPDTPFGSWKMWERGAPELAVEIVSEHDADPQTWAEKLGKYHALGVLELVAFDPEAAPGERLRGWDRIDGDLVERVVEGERSPCTVLDPGRARAGHRHGGRLDRERLHARLPAAVLAGGDRVLGGAGAVPGLGRREGGHDGAGGLAGARRRRVRGPAERELARGRRQVRRVAPAGRAGERLRRQVGEPLVADVRRGGGAARRLVRRAEPEQHRAEPAERRRRDAIAGAGLLLAAAGTTGTAAAGTAAPGVACVPGISGARLGPGAARVAVFARLTGTVDGRSFAAAQ
ncbi:Uma2 family endonuclease [Sorangium sp. So ce341]|uniref:Uma2 family endonuclease n=1 Tax=Sorangium sp. So ce341 TaxID=3133302 RepID=UPI003F5D6DCA